MKRPFPIYIVAAWCFFAVLLALGSTKQLLKSLLPEGQSNEDLLNSLYGFASILAIWHVYLLVQLKSFNRWLSVVFFGWCTFTLIWNTIAIIPRLEHFRVLIIPIIPFVLNLVSIWYLVRRSFREFAVQFVAEREQERHSRLMEKTAQKSIEREIRNRRN